MPRLAKELSPVEIRRLSIPGVHPVGGVSGLLLQVKASGAKSWILRYATGVARTSRSGRPFAARRDLGLGPFPEIGLAEARDRAREAKEKIRQGIDPVAERKIARATLKAAQAKALTFDEATGRFLKKKSKEFRNPKHALDWPRSLAMYASPVIGELPVDQVELAHVIKILEPIWSEKTETATRVRGRIEAVLDFATVSGFRSGDNPARWKGKLDAILAKPNKLKRVRHHRAVAVDDASGFLAALRKREGIAARALEFLMLTAARSGEVRLATWDEISLDKRLWIIPAERMKAGREHVVPLPEAAVQLLKELPRFEGCPFVFPSPRSKALSDMSISAVMRRMGVDAVPHGLRSTFRDWAAERTHYPREVCEMALAHAIGNAVEAAYRRGDLLEKRTRLMREWARFLEGPAQVGEVVPMRADG